MNLDAMEKQVLAGSFDGSYPVFKELVPQIGNLKIASRSRSDFGYTVEYVFEGDVDTSINIIVRDVCLELDEFNELVFARVTVLDGAVFSIEIDGKFDFTKDFSIKNINWKYVDSKSDTISYTINPEERDFGEAVYIIPDY